MGLPKPRGDHVKAKLAVVAVVVACCFSAFAATARADGSGTVSTPSVTCHWTLSAGLFTFVCATDEGSVFTCSLTFSRSDGLGVTCSGPTETLTCSSRPVPTCTLTTAEGTRTFRWVLR
jgi:hypothetical protein